MTHGLRSIHDAILVGAGTVRQDNPRFASLLYWMTIFLCIRSWVSVSASAERIDDRLVCFQLVFFGVVVGLRGVEFPPHHRPMPIPSRLI